MKSISSIALLIIALGVNAESVVQEIEMRSSDFNTFYVNGTIQGIEKTSSMLVDTGSGYTTINQDTLTKLQEIGDAVYMKKLEGTLADGSRLFVPVYRISGINLGGNCYVRDFEVAVFPAGTREILGLSTLRKVSPFQFSMEPPRLSLSNCGSS